MPVVPTTPGLPGNGEIPSPLKPTGESPSQSFLLMAAADMHNNGRLGAGKPTKGHLSGKAKVT